MADLEIPQRVMRKRGSTSAIREDEEPQKKTSAVDSTTGGTVLDMHDQAIRGGMDVQLRKTHQNATECPKARVHWIKRDAQQRKRWQATKLVCCRCDCKARVRDDERDFPLISVVFSCLELSSSPDSSPRRTYNQNMGSQTPDGMDMPNTLATGEETRFVYPSEMRKATINPRPCSSPGQYGQDPPALHEFTKFSSHSHPDSMPKTMIHIWHLETGRSVVEIPVDVWTGSKRVDIGWERDAEASARYRRGLDEKRIEYLRQIMSSIEKERRFNWQELNDSTGEPERGFPRSAADPSRPTNSLPPLHTLDLLPSASNLSNPQRADFQQGSTPPLNEAKISEQVLVSTNGLRHTT
ncbi:MAG: hypothetical protein M1837_006396 [Sclerophora amabilis]|nr:MAG: hypothetical protein M1837_006396 [Sclerophora amabilis]